MTSVAMRVNFKLDLRMDWGNTCRTRIKKSTEANSMPASDKGLTPVIPRSPISVHVPPDVAWCSTLGLTCVE